VKVTTRRDKIESMLAAEPEDVFLRYALAMELEKAGEIEPALQLHAQLVAERPPHIASYFRSAQILAETQQIEQARTFLRDGIEAARAARDFHAAAEMGEMLGDLGQYGE
jgi:tetratricopeptide (TPR) repeat protein